MDVVVDVDHEIAGDLGKRLGRVDRLSSMGNGTERAALDAGNFSAGNTDRETGPGRLESGLGLEGLLESADGVECADDRFEHRVVTFLVDAEQPQVVELTGQIDAVGERRLFGRQDRLDARQGLGPGLLVGLEFFRKPDLDNDRNALPDGNLCRRRHLVIEEQTVSQILFRADLDAFDIRLRKRVPGLFSLEPTLSGGGRNGLRRDVETRIPGCTRWFARRSFCPIGVRRGGIHRAGPLGFGLGLCLVDRILFLVVEGKHDKDQQDNDNGDHHHENRIHLRSFPVTGRDIPGSGPRHPACASSGAP
ncbi:MAG: hypothetical protein BWY66_01835 [bacterium ADurb.Bin374]|nr:MAG: hypothetical protein BWY66_01835 [bacterium ADurb.Bin374]